MSYTPTAPPAGTVEQKAVTDWVEQELKVIAAAFREADELRVTVRSAVASKPRVGDVRYADGTNWNPGSGEGLYVYKTTGWSLLG